MKKLYVLAFCVLFCLTGAAQSFSPSDTVPIYIPKAIAITPNMDYINDYFCIPQNNLIKTLDLKIFNRQGALVFHTTNKDFVWNGSVNGRVIPGATYIYILYFEYNENIPVDKKNRSETFKGTITTL
jgi:gliding motility-associated-like protein